MNAVLSRPPAKCGVCTLYFYPSEGLPSDTCSDCCAPRKSTSPYPSIAAKIAATVESKQVAYGDSFGKSGSVMRTLYPTGISPEKLDDALTIVRILDKLFRIATDKDALGESPFADIAGYALLALGRAGK